MFAIVHEDFYHTFTIANACIRLSRDRWCVNLTFTLFHATVEGVDEQNKQVSSYSKRPLWQWILLYVAVGAFVYGLVYYFIFAKKGYNPQQYQAPSQATKTVVSPTSEAPASNIYLTKTDPQKGQYLTDFAGMTLYTFDKDTKGVSNCSGTCAVNWPPYTSGATAEKNLPANITVITRSDGSKQFAWKDMPLYYYASDTKPGQLLGDGVGTVWHIVKP